MGRNEDSLLRAVDERALVNATRGGSWAHPDQSRGLARRRNLRAISGIGAPSPILLFFLGGGVALHERLQRVPPGSVLVSRTSWMSKIFTWFRSFERLTLTWRKRTNSPKRLFRCLPNAEPLM